MSEEEAETKARGTKRTRSSSDTLSSANEDDAEMKLVSQGSREYLNPIVYIEYDPNKYGDIPESSSNSKLAAKNLDFFKSENFKPKLRITRSMSKSLSSSIKVVSSNKTVSDELKTVSGEATSSNASFSASSSTGNASFTTEEKISYQRKWSNSQRLQLLEAVLEEINVLNWEAVAEKVDGKSSKSCRNHWKRKLAADLRNSLISDK
ncbi:3345_t:CDS:1 [Acaulospora morrowiae]|uniref:3345_t:CDS:1 n=1 Tax=Acaulospora morrowiae TaxID=94023 RepID=A0A9N9I4Q8_9GLOM|nr:3345_t:CDS:1 [Acaulospora morrowiae]